MSAKTLYRLSGVALIVGFILIFAGTALQSHVPPESSVGSVVISRYTNPLFVPLYLLAWIGAFLQALALPALYARVAGNIGVTGLVGFLLTAYSYIVLRISLFLTEMTLFPVLVTSPQALPAVIAWPSLLSFWFAGSLFAMFVGPLLWGIALIRGGSFSRGIGIGMTIGAALSCTLVVIPAVGSIGILLVNLALAYGGYQLLRYPVVGTVAAK